MCDYSSERLIYTTVVWAMPDLALCVAKLSMKSGATSSVVMKNLPTQATSDAGKSEAVATHRSEGASSAPLYIQSTSIALFFLSAVLMYWVVLRTLRQWRYRLV